MANPLNLPCGSYLPVQTYYDINGNVPYEEAQIIFITDVPTDPVIRHHNIAMINYVWLNHLILVENIPFKKNVHVVDCDLTVGVKVVSRVNGWDCPGLDVVISKLEEKENEIHHLSEQIKDNLEKNQLGSFFDENGDFFNLLKLASPKIQQEKNSILNLLEKDSNEHFKRRIKLFIEEVEAEHRKTIEWTYKTYFQKRLTYLKYAIEEGVSLHGKVIVCLSGNFIIGNPRLGDSEYDLTEFKASLEKMKYVVINAKSSPLSIETNPSLWLRPQIVPVQSPILAAQLGGNDIAGRLPMVYFPKSYIEGVGMQSELMSLSAHSRSYQVHKSSLPVIPEEDGDA